MPKRKPTRKEKIITAKSLRSYFGLARSKSGGSYRKSYGVYGSRTTSQRMDKRYAKAIYDNQLRKVMSITDKRRGRK